MQPTRSRLHLFDLKCIKCTFLIIRVSRSPPEKQIQPGRHGGVNSHKCIASGVPYVQPFAYTREKRSATSTREQIIPYLSWPPVCCSFLSICRTHDRNSLLVPFIEPYFTIPDEISWAFFMLHRISSLPPPKLAVGGWT